MSASAAVDISPAEWQNGDPVELLLDVLLDRYADRFSDFPGLEARIRTHLPDFWAAYADVYGEAPRQMEWVVRAFDAAVEGLEARPERLRALDRVRAQNPGWFQEQRMVGLMAYADRFAETLDGVRQTIPYLKELGITYLHLMPLLKPREGANDGGYAVQSYRAVDPRLGTMDDLRELARALHEEDIVLALDVVMNHTAREHAWAQAALDGAERYQAFYLMFENRTLPDMYERTLPEVFPDFAPGNFTYVDALDRWVWTSFHDFQWDLNYANPDVFVCMLEEMLFLANAGTDVLRLDAVPFLWKEMGTNCRNQPEAHALLRASRALMRIAAPGVLFKAEAIVAPGDIIRYLGAGGYEGKECDIAYNAALMCHLWHALASENTQLLRTALTDLPPTPDNATWLNYIRCHDDIGWGLADEDVRVVGQDPRSTRRFCADFYAGEWPDSYAEGYHFQIDEDTGEARTSGTAAALTGLQRAQVEGSPEEIDRALQRLLLMHNLIFVMKGTPLLYSGDEIGQLNDFSYLKDPLKARDNRWVHRPAMDWEKAALRHDEGRVEQRLFDGIKRFSEARKKRDVLHGQADERILITENDRLFVVERTRGDDRLLAVSNFSRLPQALALDTLPVTWRHVSFTEAVQGKPVHLSSGRIILEPYGFLWLVPAPEAPPGAPVPTPIEVEVETAWGEEVYLSGSIGALGDGDPQRAIGPLAADDAPVWTTDIEVPGGVFFEFRWLKKRRNHVTEWSPQRYGMKAGSSDVWVLEAD